MERNRRRVSTEEARKLSLLLGCSIEHLVSGAEPVNDAPMAALARVTDGLSDEDVAEVARFAAFLRTRPKPGSSA
jgi:hypothetical protein